MLFFATISTNMLPIQTKFVFFDALWSKYGVSVCVMSQWTDEVCMRLQAGSTTGQGCALSGGNVWAAVLYLKAGVCACLPGTCTLICAGAARVLSPQVSELFIWSSSPSEWPSACRGINVRQSDRVGSQTSTDVHFLIWFLNDVCRSWEQTRTQSPKGKQQLSPL